MIILRKQLKEAAYDYKYLLNRGYTSKSSLDLISGRYKLNREERTLLYRCVHSDSDVEKVRKKVELKEPLIIDGYNVGLTVLSVLEKDQVFLCDDGFIRDMNAGSKKSSPRIIDALLLLSSYLKEKGVDFIVILDSQISKSGELKRTLAGERVTVRVVERADKEVIISSGTAVTSDFVVLMKASRVYDVVQAMFPNLKAIKMPDDIS
ncbi:MAG: DUF434 domain-containing protein [Metallosphaera yellowstonensis]|uniref:DUF434 domain-containing protein n=1 Tax=Metallosphaera yellowstonensis MK1 TaxID=671065 RepID=H2C852_9CREN|nr:hypothetical protein MetMK1DRAFT_00027550 [Metallosphaera yellowstonensis MK1]